MPDHLPIPPNVKKDPNAVELVRAWASNGQQIAVIQAGAWEDPMAWGLMLVDLARHVAAAIHLDTGAHKEEVLARIKEGFDAEWNHPTDTPSGKIERKGVN
jgi:hypothetical protein